MPLSILIADDHGIVREGIRALLDSQPDLEVVGAAENGRQAVEMVWKLKPDLVIMDVAMPDLNGIDATRQLTKDYPSLKILALSTHSDHSYVREMLRAGAAGYLLKDCYFDELLFAIRAIQAGQSYLSPAIAHLVLIDFRDGDMPASTPGRGLAMSESLLTGREREVLQLLAEGHTMKEVAAELSISIKTVETHRKRISEKLGLRSISELTKYAIREGITSVQK